jgi:hypothetical protein
VPFKKWEPGEFLFAGDLQEYVMDQALMIFPAGTAAASAAIGTPTEGMVIYSGAGSAHYYSGTAWEEWPT